MVLLEMIVSPSLVADSVSLFKTLDKSVSRKPVERARKSFLVQSQLAFDSLKGDVLRIRISSDCPQDEKIVLTGKFDVLHFRNILASKISVRKRH